MSNSSSDEMLVMGMMSGTSADGIDTAIVRISGAPPELNAKLETHHHVSFALNVREQILRLANGGATTTAEVSRLDFVIGEEFARAAIAAAKSAGIRMDQIGLIGSHGQTVFHQGSPARLKGAWRVASTLQIGEPAMIAERTGVPTMANFRPSDIAAGGQGAPLVPFVDYLLYRDAERGRVALNIGGIANVTVIPAAAAPEQVMAFDTGPGNMIVDALVQGMTHGRSKYDRGAKIALGGRTIPELLSRMMREPYLRKRPPKTAGREQFGQAYVERLITWGRKHHASPADLVRTATVFTSLSIADAFRRLILPKIEVQELIVSGGGAKNPLMMAQLAASVPGVEVVPSDRLGVPTEAKEAFAFAILAYEAYHGRTNNLPSATGARHAVVMGKLNWGRAK
ncbi:MAG TPA: anhydro-N-acetylmuramic acid kinase [Candidatus Acidoferrales bacterium]|jgi:anhydro-N-acetylmuramic acid kinase|nr:anhydro-N-acetylmuramic acid kinase [Candidatus Acidoferrales bacterium]